MEIRKVLITGAGGFIGSHLVDRAVDNNLEVKAFVHYNSQNNWGHLEQIDHKNKIDVISGNIEDFQSVKQASKNVDTIFHLAALIGIPYSFTNPYSYIQTNILGTFNVLQSALENNVKNVLIISTSETYGQAEFLPISEKHPQLAKSPYAATKIGAEQLALSYYYSFKLPVKVVRPFNTYGPRQSARAIIPTIILQLLNHPSYLNIGNLEPKRDFTYVSDTVEGLMEIAKSPSLIGEVTNIGSGRQLSIKELIDSISQIMNVYSKIKNDSIRKRGADSEVDSLLADISRVKKYTRWEPKLSINAGLKKTIDWYLTNKESFKANIYNI